jgi:hypothetical protein
MTMTFDETVVATNISSGHPVITRCGGVPAWEGGVPSFALVWHSNDTNGSLKGAIYSTTAQCLAQPFQIDTRDSVMANSAGIAAVCPTANGFLVAWTAAPGASSTTSGCTVQYQTFGTDGLVESWGQASPDGQPVDANNPPSVDQLSDGNFVICWGAAGASNGVRAKVFDAGFNPIGDDFAVNTAPLAQQPSVVARDDGGFVVSFIGGSGGMMAGRFQVFSVTRDNTTNKDVIAKVGQEYPGPNYFAGDGLGALSKVAAPMGALSDMQVGQFATVHSVVEHPGSPSVQRENFLVASLWNPDGSSNTSVQIVGAHQGTINSNPAATAYPDSVANNDGVVVVWTSRPDPVMSSGNLGNQIKIAFLGPSLAYNNTSMPVNLSPPRGQDTPCCTWVAEPNGGDPLVAVAWIDMGNEPPPLNPPPTLTLRVMNFDEIG